LSGEIKKSEQIASPPIGGEAMTLISRSLILGGGVGWRLRRQPTPPHERISQIAVIAIRQLAEKQSIVFTGQ